MLESAYDVTRLSSARLLPEIVARDDKLPGAQLEPLLRSLRELTDAEESDLLDYEPGGSELRVVYALRPYGNNVMNTGQFGSFSMNVDLTAIPQHGQVMPGETWNFQAWFRDNNPTTTSNFTDGYSILFQ